MFSLGFLGCCFVLGCGGFFWNGVGKVLLFGFFSAKKKSWIESEWLLQHPLELRHTKGSTPRCSLDMQKCKL